MRAHRNHAKYTARRHADAAEEAFHNVYENAIEMELDREEIMIYTRPANQNLLTAIEREWRTKGRPI
jgi:hypothetical protein